MCKEYFSFFLFKLFLEMNGGPKGINQNSRKLWFLQSFETLLFLKQIAKLKLHVWGHSQFKFCSWWLKLNQLWVFDSCSVKNFESNFCKNAHFQRNILVFNIMHFTQSFFPFYSDLEVYCHFFSVAVANWIRSIL